MNNSSTQRGRKRSGVPSARRSSSSKPHKISSTNHDRIPQGQPSLRTTHTGTGTDAANSSSSLSLLELRYRYDEYSTTDALTPTGFRPFRELNQWEQRAILEVLAKRQTTFRIDRLLELLRALQPAIQDQELIGMLEMAVKEHGFRSRCRLDLRTIDVDNDASAYENAEVMHAEVTSLHATGRVIGPYAKKEIPFPRYRVSKLYVIPKKTPGKFRVIIHMSYPEGDSLNDARDLLVPIKFMDVRDLKVRATKLKEQSPDLIFQISVKDLKGYYLQIPIRPIDVWQFGFKWFDVTRPLPPHASTGPASPDELKYYFYTCYPFGYTGSVDLAHRLSRHLRLLYVHADADLEPKLPLRAYDSHIYLDDFANVTAKGYLAAADQRFENLMAEVGLPISLKDLEGLKYKDLQQFLGILVNIAKSTIKIPDDKIELLLEMLAKFISSQVTQEIDIQRLCGSLEFAAICAPKGRRFLRRLYDALKFHGHKKWIKVTKGMRQDAQWWQTLFHNWDGTQFLPENSWVHKQDMLISSDATPRKYAAVNLETREFFHGNFPEHWYLLDISTKELLVMFAMLLTWGPTWRNRRIVLDGDNLASVMAINRGIAKDAAFASLLRRFFHEETKQGCVVRARHVRTQYNVLADAASRDDWGTFYQHLKLTYDLTSLQLIELPKAILTLGEHLVNLKRQQTLNLETRNHSKRYLQRLNRRARGSDSKRKLRRPSVSPTGTAPAHREIDRLYRLIKKPSASTPFNASHRPPPHPVATRMSTKAVQHGLRLPRFSRFLPSARSA